MKPFLFPTFLGRSWTVRNESCRPDDEVLALLGFVLDRTGGLSAKGAIHVRDAGSRTRGNYSGVAGSRKLGHSIPAWVGGRVRFYMRLTLPLDDWAGYGVPEVCGHSTTQRRLMGEIGALKLTEMYEAMLARGETKLGRWPIFRLWNWQEVLVNLGAHEAAHLVQYERERGHSEVWCEEFALQILNEYRAARPCGGEHNPTSQGVEEARLDPAGPLSGLATGPATADPSTNRKEPTVATTTSTEAKPDPKPGKAADSAKAAAAPAKSASDSDGKQELFDTLLGEITGLADKTAETKRSQYVRVDVLLAEGKKKTLVYLHYPTKKSVRAVVPAKTGSDFDTVAVEKAADIPKAVKVIRNRLAKVTA